MTEQELNLEIGKKISNLGGNTTTYNTVWSEVFDIAKTYAAAQVATKDTDIAWLKAEVSRYENGLAAFLCYVDNYNDYGVKHNDIRSEIDRIFWPKLEEPVIPSVNPAMHKQGVYCLRSDHSARVVAGKKAEAARLLKAAKADVLCLVQPMYSLPIEAKKGAQND